MGMTTCSDHLFYYHKGDSLVEFIQFSIGRLECLHERSFEGNVELLENLIVLFKNISDVFVDVECEIIISENFSDAFEDNLNDFG